MDGLPGFNTKKEEFGYLVANKKQIIRMKRSKMKFTDSIGSNFLRSNISSKSYKIDEYATVINKTIVGNTYNYMDSQDDVLLSGVFNKSIKENQDKIFHLKDHKFEISAKVGEPTSVYEKTIPWREVGLDREGKTEALIMESDIMKAYDERVFNDYKEGRIDQHSVGLSYVRLDLAVNDEEYKQEFAIWNKYFGLLGNPELAEEKGFFWAVMEAKLIEISAVLLGANPLTPTLDDKSKPPYGAHKKPQISTSGIDYRYLIENLKIN